jgi:hypothetical protein
LLPEKYIDMDDRLEKLKKVHEQHQERRLRNAGETEK